MGVEFDKGRLAAKVKTKDQEFYLVAIKTADSNWFSNDGGNITSVSIRVLPTERQFKEFLYAIYDDYLGGILADGRNRPVSPYAAFNRLNTAVNKMETLDFSNEELSDEALVERIIQHVGTNLSGSLDFPIRDSLTPESLVVQLSKEDEQTNDENHWDELTSFMKRLKTEKLDGLPKDAIIRHAILNGDQALFNNAIRFLYFSNDDALMVEAFQTPQVASGGEYNNALGYAFMTEQGHQYLMNRAKQWQLSNQLRPASRLVLDLLYSMNLGPETDKAYRKQVVEQFSEVLEKEAEVIEQIIGKTPEGMLLTPRMIAQLMNAVILEEKPYDEALAALMEALGKDKDTPIGTVLHDYQALKEQVPELSHSSVSHKYLGILSRFGLGAGEISSAYETALMDRKNSWMPDKIAKSDAASYANYLMRVAGLQPDQKEHLKASVSDFLERLRKTHQTSDARKLIEIATQDLEHGKVSIWSKETGMEQKAEQQAEVAETPKDQDKSKVKKKKGIQRIVEGFIEGIERAAEKDWEKPWQPVVLPKGVASASHNGKSGNIYRGFNAMIADSVRMASGYIDPRFYTFKQAKELGGSVKKGAKAVIISAPVLAERESTYEVTAVKTGEAYKKAAEALNKEEDKTNETEEQAENTESLEKTVKQASGKVIGLRPVYVFHISDLENMPPEHQPLDDTVGIDFDKQHDTEVFKKVIDRLKEIGLNVEVGGSRAFYTVGTKDIRVPMPERFKGEDEEELVRTVFHEAAHATKGIGVKREFIEELKKLAEKRGWTQDYMNKVSYAIEEGVAEMAANLMATRLGFHAGQENHAAYMKNWLIDGLGNTYGKPSNANNNKPFDIHGDQEAFTLYKMIKDAGKAVETIMSEEFVNEIESLRRKQYMEIKGAEARSPDELKQIRKNVEKSAQNVEMDALLDALSMQHESDASQDKQPLSNAAEQVKQALESDEPSKDKDASVANGFF